MNLHASPFALVVQHDPADTPGAVACALDRAGIEARDVRGFAGDVVPEAIGDAAALVVMGGPMAADDLEAHPFLRLELRLIASALNAHVPILGICLGAQLLAVALSGGVVREGACEIGWCAVEQTELPGDRDPLFEALPAHFVPFHWHADAIVLPPGATRLARSDRTVVQAYRAGPPSRCTYGLQFHLESDAGMIRTMMRSFAGELRAKGIDASALEAETRRRIGEQERLAEIFFRRWTELVGARSGVPRT
jgi:GMP synthase-like glutamine amidotransferase